MIIQGHFLLAHPEYPAAQAEKELGRGEVSHMAGGRGGGNSHTNWSADPERSYS